MGWATRGLVVGWGVASKAGGLSRREDPHRHRFCHRGELRRSCVGGSGIDARAAKSSITYEQVRRVRRYYLNFLLSTTDWGIRSRYSDPDSSGELGVRWKNTVQDGPSSERCGLLLPPGQIDRYGHSRTSSRVALSGYRQSNERFRPLGCSTQINRAVLLPMVK